jgi:hypothetical protein
MIHRYLPKMEYIYLAGRVTDLKDKTVAALENSIRHGDMDRMAAIRRNKRTL